MMLFWFANGWVSSLFLGHIIIVSSQINEKTHPYASLKLRTTV